MTVARVADPAQYAESWPLLHAHSLTIRALQPEHADLEVRFGLALSPQSRYERFLGGGVKLTPELLARLVNVDFSRDAALIATVAFAESETPVGVARYALTDDDDIAEIAVTIADAWQGCGLGRLLARARHRRRAAERRAAPDRRCACRQRADAGAGTPVRLPHRVPPGRRDAPAHRQGPRRRADCVRRYAASGSRRPKPDDALELLLGERQHARRALDDRIAQAARLRQEVIGEEPRSPDLRVEERGIALAARELRAAPRPRARAICQPPQTMPISFRNGTAPACAAFASVP